jgi:hypothetical protein
MQHAERRGGVIVTGDDQGHALGGVLGGAVEGALGDAPRADSHTSQRRRPPSDGDRAFAAAVTVAAATNLGHMARALGHDAAARGCYARAAAVTAADLDDPAAEAACLGNCLVLRILRGAPGTDECLRELASVHERMVGPEAHWTLSHPLWPPPMLQDIHTVQYTLTRFVRNGVGVDPRATALCRCSAHGTDFELVFWISSKCGVSFVSHVGLVEVQINLFKLVFAFYLTFDPKRVVRDF